MAPEHLRKRGSRFCAHKFATGRVKGVCDGRRKCKKLADELKKYNRICYYPSSGRDLSDLDYFGSGRLLWNERVESSCRFRGRLPKAANCPIFCPFRYQFLHRNSKKAKT